jgi:hypothetical protein
MLPLASGVVWGAVGVKRAVWGIIERDREYDGV